MAKEETVIRGEREDDEVTREEGRGEKMRSKSKGEE